MTKTDSAVAVLNAATVIVAVFGLIDNPYYGVNGPQVALLLAIVTAMVNGGWIIRRGSLEPMPTPKQIDAEDVTLDARHLLDIDERLEALERHDERTLRSLADRGEVSPPASLPETRTTGAGRSRVTG